METVQNAIFSFAALVFLVSWCAGVVFVFQFYARWSRRRPSDEYFAKRYRERMSFLHQELDRSRAGQIFLVGFIAFLLPFGLLLATDKSQP